MNKKSGFLLWVVFFVFGGWIQGLAGDGAGVVPRPEKTAIGMAVEFTSHAADAYIALEKGWFAAAGLNITAFESYATGMALAAALTRGDIQAAYICLVPAINACVNAGVPIKIVAGTHKNGYGLVVDPEKISTVRDLGKPGVRIGCIREGGAVDVFLNKIIDEYHLDRNTITANVRRMNPENQMMAIVSGRLDAVFVPEQWATMVESAGFTMLLTSRDVWPRMQGSVLVVKANLISESPEVVKKLVEVTRRANDWQKNNLREAAEIVARRLQAADIESLALDKKGHPFMITPEVAARSMQRMDYTLDIDPEEVRKVIDYLDALGYLKHRIEPADILDLRFIADDPAQ